MLHELLGHFLPAKAQGKPAADRFLPSVQDPFAAVGLLSLCFRNGAEIGADALGELDPREFRIGRFRHFPTRSLAGAGDEAGQALGEVSLAAVPPNVPLAQTRSPRGFVRADPG